MQNKSLNCPFCKKQHNVKLNENQFFEYDCDEFGYIFISKRAVTEFKRHPSRIDLTKIKAIECKQKKGMLRITYSASDNGLKISCE